ncbi:SatD family protein [Aquimarina sp. MAR_2010_214]|uniref:SatD family protein n=1 Tax=Aquimarina sp. MAR_2010_214 TaxID=1250026 RepID=UPI000C6FE4C4|nr:SatD family protein [Aquimarina sp. MAR_2010_214]PKV50944.1 SatD family protein [Aquimarina sp. MAR_2010_214]
MISILTGDIINSRERAPQQWIPLLKKVFEKYGSEPNQWEIYRGDSFQIEIPIEQALEVVFLIKATIKQCKPLDVRIAIGIGEKTYTSKKITESNGDAFERSGECFENLKKQNIAIKSPWEEFDSTINLMLRLALLTMNDWKPAYSSIVKTALENPKKTQKQLAELLGKTQSTVSEGLKRSGYEEMSQLISYYINYIKTK